MELDGLSEGLKATSNQDAHAPETNIPVRDTLLQLYPKLEPERIAWRLDQYCQPAFISQMDYEGNTPLHAALGSGALQDEKIRNETLRQLLSDGAEVNIPNLFGSTPFHSALRHPVFLGPSVFQLLLDHGADVLSPTPTGLFALSIILLALRSYNSIGAWVVWSKPIRRFVDKGADPNFIATGSVSVLYELLEEVYVSFSSADEVIKILLQAGANPICLGQKGHFFPHAVYRKMKEAEMHGNSSVQSIFDRILRLVVAALLHHPLVQPASGWWWNYGNFVRNHCDIDNLEGSPRFYIRRGMWGGYHLIQDLLSKAILTCHDDLEGLYKHVLGYCTEYSVHDSNDYSGRDLMDRKPQTLARSILTSNNDGMFGLNIIE